MSLGDMRIGVRMALGFAVMLVLMTVIAVTGFSRLSTVNTELSAMVEGPIKRNSFAEEWLRAISMNVGNTVAQLRSDNAEDQAYYQAQTDKQGAVITDLMKKADENISSDPEEIALYKNILDKRQQFVDIRLKLLALQKSGDKDALRKGIDQDLSTIVNGYLTALTDMKAYYQRGFESSVATTANTYQYGTVVLFSTLIAGLVIGILTAYLLTRSVTKPIQKAVSVAESIASGDLIQHDASKLYKDETGLLLLSLRRMRENLLNTVGLIRKGSDSISTSATEVASGNLDLSSRTEEQASSLEETASSMEELTSTVKQNADNASQAHSLSLHATDSAKKGQQVIDQVVSTMHDITSSSHKMEDIINVIDGIAFQTNILALNAAVEAARAGEQGRGFAVVATEVRNLAQRSASAAKEIKALIDTSVSQVKQGSVLAANAGSVMTEIAEGAQRSTDVIAEISAASKEQSAGIEQVSQAIMQLDQVTQQNAALVEQSAAASESMKDQAQKLVDAVSIFKIAASDLNNVVAAMPKRNAVMKEVNSDQYLLTNKS